MQSTRWLCLYVMLIPALVLAQAHPVPLVQQPLVPTSVAPGGPGFTLTVNGTGFVTESVVRWNGSALTTHFVSSAQLIAIVPSADVTTAGTTAVTVVSPGPGGGTSNAVFFTVSSLIAAPVFTALPPNPGFPPGGYSAQVADVNGDGKLDLVYVAGNSVRVQLGNGDGTFQAPASYAVGSEPFALATGDFNGDGKLDLVVANFLDATVSVLLGNGDGTFQPQTTFATACRPLPLSLVAGDFNGDGKLDLATGNSRPCATGVSVLLGHGDGTFQPHVDYGESGVTPTMALGDFNGDGTLDLIYFVPNDNPTNDGPNLAFLAGNGDGTFQPLVRFPFLPLFSDVQAVRAADLNGDDKLDLIIAVNCFTTTCQPSVLVLLGNGDGTFQPPQQYGLGLLPFSLVVSDLNADGTLDLVLDHSPGPGRSSRFFMLLGNDNGTFQNAILLPPLPSSPLPIIRVAAAGDFDGDGKMDLALDVFSSETAQRAIVVLLQGQFPAVSIAPSTLTFSPQVVGTTSAPRQVTLTNTGLAPVTLAGISFTGANASDFAQSNACGSALAVGATCQISVTFTPGAPGGRDRSATLRVDGDAVGSPQTVSVTGSTLAPVVTVSPTTVTFPPQFVGTSSLPITVTLTNSGTGALIITSVTTSPADFAPLSACGNSVAPGTNCAIGVFFAPTAAGTRTGTLTITDNASNSPQTVALTGTGQDFSITTTAATTATITAGQAATYTLSVTPGGGFNQMVSFTCSGAPAQSTCTISPGALALDGSASSPVTVTVSTAAVSAAMLRPFTGFRTGGTFGVAFPIVGLLGPMLLVSSGWRRDRRRVLMLALMLGLLFYVAVTMSACGGGGGSSSGGGGSAGTSKGTYTLTVSGASNASSTVLRHDAQLTLIVQ